MRKTLSAFALAATITAPTLAQELPLQLQWRRTPEINMRTLIDEGYEIKSMAASTETLEAGRYDTVTYLLQRAAEVYRCVEGGVIDDQGALKSQVVYCSVLVTPYDANAKAAG